MSTEPPSSFAGFPNRPRSQAAEGSFEVRDGARIGLWSGARVRGETGVQVATGCAAFSLFEITAVPDFSSSRFPDLAQLDEASRTSTVGDRQSQFLAALHQLGPLTGICLRYHYMRTAAGEGRIRIFLLGRSFDADVESARRAAMRLRELVRAAFPAEYRLLEVDSARADATANRVVTLEGARSVVEILKYEQTIPAWHDAAVCGFCRYYVPGSFEAASNTMVDVCRALTSVPCGEMLVDVCLVPSDPLTDVEKGELKNWAVLCDRWSREQKFQVGGGLYSKPTEVVVKPDPAAAEVKKIYEKIGSQYGTNARLFLYAVRVVSWNDDPPYAVATSLASSALKAGASSRAIGVPPDDPRFAKAWNAARWCSLSPAICHHDIWQSPDAPETLRRLHRLANIQEIEGFFRLPIPGRLGCPGIALDTGLAATAAGTRASARLSLGAFVEGYRLTADEASLPVESLAKSALVVGVPGSGKTTFCFSVLTQLWREHRIPFLVLEPGKCEYRSLLNVTGFRDDIWVFSVGNERVSPFRINPFEVLDGVGVSEHISALNTCFSGAFSLWDPLPMIIDRAIREAYAERGWSEYAVGGEEPDLEAPTLEDLYRHALEIAEGTSYRGETAGNIRGALEARLGALLRGPKGRTFNCRQSVPAPELMKRPVVLELDALNDEERALMMMFAMTFVREYAKATRKPGSPLRHALLIEEAHNVIGRNESGGGDAQANPQAVAMRFFTRMLAEMRALGEGIVVADQLPTAIAPEAIKNTNLKVMHRLVSADDREELGRAMVFDGGQMEQAAVLLPGQSFVFMEGLTRSRLVAEPDFKRQYGIDQPPEDATVAELMEPVRQREDLSGAFLPYRGCADRCRTCVPRVRESYERHAEKILPELRRVMKNMARDQLTAEAAQSYFLDLPEPTAGSADALRQRVSAHCAAVHFTRKVLDALRISKR